MAQMAQMGQPQPPAAPAKPAQRLIFKDGQMVDAITGKVVTMEKREAEFKANREDASALEGEGFEEAAAPNFDERLNLKAKRERRGFSFHKQGDFVTMASKQRARAQLEKLQEQIAAASKKTGISSAAKLAMIAPFKNDTEDLVVPDIEWWDALILPGKNYTSLDNKDGATDGKERFPNITHLIQHPILLRAPNEPAAEPEMKVFTTKAERKKIRSQRRKAEEKERQEKIKLGLMDAPAPKVSKSNFMKILTNDAVADPTQMEKLVQRQMEIRQQNHQEANDSRALTKEQKTEKKIKKLKESTDSEVHVAVFRVNDLEGNQKFKVEMNAKQFYLTGICVRTKEDLTLIVVEGGPKGIKNYKKLMLKRIKWSPDDDESSDEDLDEDMEGGAKKKKKNKCLLVWEGAAQKRAFTGFEVKGARTEGFARELFVKHGVPQYWDMALADQVIEEAS
jgi:U4/U6 small nuclear ribonucleoprotein PRP3